jgi:hypothetical protein
LLAASFVIFVVGFFMNILSPRLGNDAGLSDLLARILDIPIWIVLPFPLIYWSLKKAEKNPLVEHVDGLSRYKSDGFCTSDILNKKSIDSLASAGSWIGTLGGIIVLFAFWN